MNDCFWYYIGVCKANCQCDKYTSLNSEEGMEMTSEYDEKVQEHLKSLKKEYKNKLRKENDDG